MIGLLLLSGCDAEAGAGMMMGATGGIAGLMGASIGAFVLWRQTRREERIDQLAETVTKLREQVEAAVTSARRAERTVRELAERAADEDARAERMSLADARDGMARPGIRGGALGDVPPRVGLPRAGADGGAAAGMALPRAESSRGALGRGAPAQNGWSGRPHDRELDEPAPGTPVPAEGHHASAATAVAEVGAPADRAPVAADGPGAGAAVASPAEGAEPGSREPEKAGPDEEARRWLDSLRNRPHGEVAAALGSLYLQSRQLGRQFRDPGTAALFQQEMEQAVPQRLQRLVQLRAEAHPSHVQEWVEVDLVPTLDSLGKFLSAAAGEQREGHAPAGVAYEALADALYVGLHAACLREGWFGIPTIRPYETDFDPRVHQAVGNRAEPGAGNRILEIRKIGLVDARAATVLAPAHVVVGR